MMLACPQRIVKQMSQSEINKETAHSGRASSLSQSYNPQSEDVLGYAYNSTKSGLITRGLDNQFIGDSLITDNQKLIRSLDTTTNYVSKRYKGNDQWQELAVIRRVMAGSSYRVAGCMHTKGGVAKLMRHEDKHYYDSIMPCGSVWTCPVCGRRIAKVRRKELRQAIVGSGFTPVMVTVTLQHGLGDGLGDLMTALTDSLRRLKSGRWWQDFKTRYGVKAHVASLEIRWSPVTGWHPHKHMVIMCDLNEVDIPVETIKREITERYKALLAESGHYASEYHSVDVRVGNEFVGDYVAKWGLSGEMAMSGVKRSSAESLHPIELGIRADKGDRQAYRLWMDYCRFTLGKRQMTWSHHGREVMGLGVEVSDEDLAVDKAFQEDELIAEIKSGLWSFIIDKGLAGVLLDKAREGGKEMVTDYLGYLERERHKRGEWIIPQ